MDPGFVDAFLKTIELSHNSLLFRALVSALFYPSPGFLEASVFLSFPCANRSMAGSHASVCREV